MELNDSVQQFTNIKNWQLHAVTSDHTNDSSGVTIQIHQRNSTIFTAYSTSVKWPVHTWKTLEPLMKWIIQWERINNINQSRPIKSNGLHEKSFCRNIIKMQGSKQWPVRGQSLATMTIYPDKSSTCQSFWMDLSIRDQKIRFTSIAFQEDKHPFHGNYGTNWTYSSSFGSSVIVKAP